MMAEDVSETRTTMKHLDDHGFRITEMTVDVFNTLEKRAGWVVPARLTDGEDPSMWVTSGVGNKWRLCRYVESAVVKGEWQLERSVIRFMHDDGGMAMWGNTPPLDSCLDVDGETVAHGGEKTGGEQAYTVATVCEEYKEASAPRNHLVIQALVAIDALAAEEQAGKTLRDVQATLRLIRVVAAAGREE